MSQTQQEQHTVIHVSCDECDAVDTVTHLEHPKESKQYEIVAEAVHQVADEHADATGHHVKVGESEGEPEAAASIAKGLAEDIAGADPDSFEGAD